MRPQQGFTFAPLLPVYEILIGSWHVRAILGYCLQTAVYAGLICACVRVPFALYNNTFFNGNLFPIFLRSSCYRSCNSAKGILDMCIS